MTWYTTIRSTISSKPVVTIVENDDGTFTALGDTMIAQELRDRPRRDQPITGTTPTVRAWQWIGTSSAPYLKADPPTKEPVAVETVQPTPEAFLASSFDESKVTRDEAGKFSSGGGGGGGAAGTTDIEQLLEDNPREPGEDVFVYQSRIVEGLPQETKSDILFALRERYTPVPSLREGASRWNEEHGLDPIPGNILDQHVDLDEAAAVARYFETAPDQSNDPEVAVAYDDFKRQNQEMYDYMTRPESEGGMGVKVDFTDKVDPYGSAAAQAEDLRVNNHITIQSGLGGEHSASMSTAEYDVFRAVHDTFGHAAVGGGFDRHGEYQAWLMHSTMYTGPGRLAMSSEYHGVNSALWSGEPGTPGTGKTVLLPGQYGLPPWERGRAIVGAVQPDVRKVIKALGLDTEWARRYSALPWHPMKPADARLGFVEEDWQRAGGRFESFVGAKQEPGERNPERASDELASLVTSTRFGSTDPIEATPLGSGQTRWGRTTMSEDEFNRVQGEAAIALQAAGYQPDQVEDAVYEWTQANLDPLRAVYEGADPSTIDENYRDGAQQLSELITNTTVDGDVWRGKEASADELRDLMTEGHVITNPLSSWSRDGNVAEVFSDVPGERPGDPLYRAPSVGQSIPVLLHINDPVRGVDISPLGSYEQAWQEEVIVGDRQLRVAEASGEQKAIRMDENGDPVLAYVIEMEPVPQVRVVALSKEREDELGWSLLGETFAEFTIKHHPETMPPARTASSFDESAHPRDDRGRFGDDGGGPTSAELRAETTSEGGFTYSVLDQSLVHDGVAVSPYPDREQIVPVSQFTADQIDTYEAENADLLAQPDHYLGAWLNPDDNNVYLDVSIVEPTAEEAAQVARDHGQLATFNLATGETYQVESGRATQAATEAATTDRRVAAQGRDPSRERSAGPGDQGRRPEDVADTGDPRHVSRETSRVLRQVTKLRQSLGTRLIAMAEQAYEAALTQAGGRVKGRARSRLSKARQGEAARAVDARHPLRAWLGAVGITELEMLRGSFDTFATNVRAEYQRYEGRVRAVVAGTGVAFDLDVDAAVGYLVAALTAQTRRRLLIGDEAMLAAVAPRLIPRARRPNPAGYDLLGLPDPEELAAAAARLVRNATSIAEGRAIVTYPVTPDEIPEVETRDEVQTVEEQLVAVVNVRPVWTWSHGFYGEPKTVFPPHNRLDGFRTVDRDNDPRLVNNEPWPPGTVYAPLDHDGCTCEWVIEVSG